MGDVFSCDPGALLNFVAQELLKVWQPSPDTSHTRVFDPALGDGELLLAVWENLEEEKIKVSVSEYEANESEMLFGEARIRGQFSHADVKFRNEDFLAQSVGYLAQPSLFQFPQPEQFACNFESALRENPSYGSGEISRFGSPIRVSRKGGSLLCVYSGYCSLLRSEGHSWNHRI